MVRESFNGFISCVDLLQFSIAAKAGYKYKICVVAAKNTKDIWEGKILPSEAKLCGDDGCYFCGVKNMGRNVDA